MKGGGGYSICYREILSFSDSTQSTGLPSFWELGSSCLSGYSCTVIGWSITEKLVELETMTISFFIVAFEMSKSLGNVVNPNEAAQRLTVEGLRYFLLRQGVPHEDSSLIYAISTPLFFLPDYTEKKAVEVINADLVNNLGNLLSRSTIDKLNPAQVRLISFHLK